MGKVSQILTRFGGFVRGTRNCRENFFRCVGSGMNFKIRRVTHCCTFLYASAPLSKLCCQACCPPRSPKHVRKPSAANGRSHDQSLNKKNSPPTQLAPTGHVGRCESALPPVPGAATNCPRYFCPRLTHPSSLGQLERHQQVLQQLRHMPCQRCIVRTQHHSRLRRRRAADRHLH